MRHVIRVKQQAYQTLYEQLLLGKITSDEYIIAKASIDVGRSEKSIKDSLDNIRAIQAAMQSIVDENRLNSEAVELLVEKVHVFPNRDIAVYFTADALENMSANVGA